MAPTLFAARGIFSPVSFGLALIRDLTGHTAGDVQLADIQRGLAEGRDGGEHAGVAVGRAVQGGQVQRLPARDDGDVERELAPTIRGRGLADGERGRGGELAAGPWRFWRLSVEEFVVLAAGEEQF